jgi:hypothetical protein
METNADMIKGGEVLKLFTDDGIAGSAPFKDVLPFSADNFRVVTP